MFADFSSDDFRSDVCAAHDPVTGLYVTRTASMRLLGDAPRLDDSSDDRRAESLGAQHEFVRTAAFRPLGLPMGGSLFVDADPMDMRQRLADLRAVGYRVPPGTLRKLEAVARGEDVREYTAAGD